MTGKHCVERRGSSKKNTRWDSNSGHCERSYAECRHTNYEAIGADADGDFCAEISHLQVLFSGFVLKCLLHRIHVCWYSLEWGRSGVSDASRPLQRWGQLCMNVSAYRHPICVGALGQYKLQTDTEMHALKFNCLIAFCAQCAGFNGSSLSLTQFGWTGHFTFSTKLKTKDSNKQRPQKVLNKNGIQQNAISWIMHYTLESVRLKNALQT